MAAAAFSASSPLLHATTHPTPSLPCPTRCRGWTGTDCAGRCGACEPRARAASACSSSACRPTQVSNITPSSLIIISKYRPRPHPHPARLPAGPECAAKAAQAGMSEFIPKPFRLQVRRALPFAAPPGTPRQPRRPGGAEALGSLTAATNSSAPPPTSSPGSADLGGSRCSPARRGEGEGEGERWGRG